MCEAEGRSIPIAPVHRKRALESETRVQRGSRSSLQSCANQFRTTSNHTYSALSNRCSYLYIRALTLLFALAFPSPERAQRLSGRPSQHSPRDSSSSPTTTTHHTHFYAHSLSARHCRFDPGYAHIYQLLVCQPLRPQCRCSIAAHSETPDRGVLTSEATPTQLRKYCHHETSHILQGGIPASSGACLYTSAARLRASVSSAAADRVLDSTPRGHCEPPIRVDTCQRTAQ
jgi:hypothetical protein